MMKTYARIDRGIFMERIDPKPYDSEAWDWFEGDPSRIGTEEPIEDRYTAELVATMVEITGLNPLPLPGWTYANGIFAPPVPYMPTPAETLEAEHAYAGWADDPGRVSHRTLAGCDRSWRCDVSRDTAAHKVEAIPHRSESDQLDADRSGVAVAPRSRLNRLPEGVDRLDILFPGR